jgi:hypothetical protein
MPGASGHSLQSATIPLVGVSISLCSIHPQPCLQSRPSVSLLGADGPVGLALADAEYLGPADSTNTLSGWLAVLQRYLFRVLDLPFGPALEAIGIHCLSPSSVYFDSQDTRKRAALSTHIVHFRARISGLAVTRNHKPKARLLAVLFVYPQSHIVMKIGYPCIDRTIGGKGPAQCYNTGELSVPANTCQARTDLAVRLRNIYPYSPQT